MLLKKKKRKKKFITEDMFLFIALVMKKILIKKIKYRNCFTKILEFFQIWGWNINPFRECFV